MNEYKNLINNFKFNLGNSEGKDHAGQMPLRVEIDDNDPRSDEEIISENQ